VAIAYLAGIIVSVVIVAFSDRFYDDNMRDWAVLTILVTLPIVAFVAMWRLKKGSLP